MSLSHLWAIRYIEADVKCQAAMLDGLKLDDGYLCLGDDLKVTDSGWKNGLSRRA